MEKSELYHLAEIAVVNSPSISPENKLNILWLLRECEKLALWQEEHDAELEKVVMENEA